MVFTEPSRANALLLLTFLSLWSTVAGMIPYPVPRAKDDWAPKQHIKAFYLKSVSGEDAAAQGGVPAKIQEARFFINSSIPAVNLDNFPHISSVECMQDNSTLRLNFTDLESAQRAFQEWFQERQSTNMSLYVNHHHNCFGKSHIQALHVNSISISDSSLLLDTNWLNQTVVFGNYEALIGEVEDALAPPKVSHFIGKRGSKETVKSKVYDFDVNYRNGSIINRNFSLFDFRKNVMLQYPRISAACIDCHTKGNATFSIHVRTENGLIAYYRIQAKGYFHANSDFQFNFPKASEKRMISFAPIFTPIGPSIDIPGLFFFGHQFGIVGSWSYAANMPFHLLFGFETTKAFDVVIESPNGGGGKGIHLPNVTRLPTEPSKTKSHKSSIENTTDITYALHLSPMVDLSLRAFQINLVNFRLSFDTAIGLETRRGKALTCTNVEMDYAMYMRDTFNFDIAAGTWGLSIWRFGVGWNGFALWRKHFEIWATKYIPIQCDFCADVSKCPAGYVNLNRTTPEQAKLDNFS